VLRIYFILKSIFRFLLYFNHYREPVRIIKAKKRLGVKEGDHLTLINIFMRYNKMRGNNDKTKLCKENNLNEKSLKSA